jgi:hypothetical protein
MNRMTTIALALSLSSSALAGSLGVPADLKVGADFLWYLSKIDRAQDAAKFVEAKVPQDQAANAQIAAVIKSLYTVRGSLQPSVDVVHQIPFSIDIGEQKVIYRIYSQTRGSKFFEVHILGKARPPTIAGVKELDSNQVINLLAKPKVMSIPQK